MKELRNSNTILIIIIIIIIIIVVVVVVVAAAAAAAVFSLSSSYPFACVLIFLLSAGPSMLPDLLLHYLRAQYCEMPSTACGSRCSCSIVFLGKAWAK